MSISTGIDVVDVDRIGRLLSAGPAPASALFTPRELAYSAGRRRRTEHLAARFAAKEAVLKAIGTGLGPRMRWTEIEIVNDVFGRPHVSLAGTVAAAARRKGLDEIAISMAHSHGVAVAHAVATTSTVPSPHEHDGGGRCDST
jgi:holo-[acyl-carrier protein] synthase